MVTLRLIAFFFAVGTLVLVTGGAAVMAALQGFSKDLPDYQSLRNYEPPVTTRLHASDGTLMAEYARERRLYLPIQAMPDLLKNAFLSAEDKSFYEHFGIDFYGVARAALSNVRGGPLQGASTITQQVAKVFLLTNERSYERKVREAIIALRMEQAFTKDQILELYLNEIYLGLGAYGVGAAALIYFDKSVHELTLDEVAYLAALPKAPNNYHPFRETQRAVDRRNWVVNRMVDNGFVSLEDADVAKSRPLNVIPRERGIQLDGSEYFTEEVRRILSEQYGEKGLYEGGLSVRTTLDPIVQRKAQKALADGLQAFDRKKGWRGAIARIDLNGGEWGESLFEVKPKSGQPDWKLATVLSLDSELATIGLRPDRLVSGEITGQRTTGSIAFSQMEWAKPAVGENRGRAPKQPQDVLQPGDVIYVEPLRSEEGEVVPGQYSLRQIPEVSGALVAMDPQTGRVLAIAGGFSFEESQFNRATQAFRQPGSAFKPIVYAAALDNGYTPSSVVLDGPIEVQNGTEVWRPQNYGGEFYGPSTLRLGIEKSRNAMTVRLAQDMGMPLVAEYARRFGIYDDMLPVLAMSLGAGETTVMRMTTAYATIANGGRQVNPSLIDRIQDRYGRTVFKHDDRVCEACVAQSWDGQDEPEIADNRDYVLDPMTAYQITSMMEGVVQRGTATSLRELSKPVAGKTGTTNDEKDAWFVGFTPDLVTGVYVGYDTPKPMGKGQTGGAVAAPIFLDFMTAALEGKPGVEFAVPRGLTLIPIDGQTGLQTAGDGNNIIMEAFKPGTAPPDNYSIIDFAFEGTDGFTFGYDQAGDGATAFNPEAGQNATPEAGRAALSGAGGLY